MGKNLDDYTPAPYVPADAVSREAKPGYKSGNPLLDNALEEIRKHSITERFKRLYKIIKGK